MTKTSDTGSTAQSSQDCSICLNSIAVSRPSETCRRSIQPAIDASLLLRLEALPVLVCRPLLPHLALQVHPLLVVVSTVPHFHLPKLPGCRRPGGRGRGPRGLGTARFRQRTRGGRPGSPTGGDRDPAPAPGSRGTSWPTITVGTAPGLAAQRRNDANGTPKPTSSLSRAGSAAHNPRDRRSGTHSRCARCARQWRTPRAYRHNRTDDK